MARQPLKPGKTIDALTPGEAAQIFTKSARPHLLWALGAGDVEQPFDDVPFEGMRSLVTSRWRQDGSDNLVVAAATFQDVTDTDIRRVGGSLINTGSNPMYVYLQYARELVQQGFGHVQGFAGYLAANGAWDFKISNEVWKGPVAVYSVLGTTGAWGVV